MGEDIKIDWDRLQGLQAEKLVVGCPKVIAHKSGLALDTIYRAKQGRPTSLITSLRISRAQHNFDYIALLLERCGLLLSSLRKLPRNGDLAVVLMDRLGSFFRFCSKLEEETVLDDHDMRELEQVGEEIKATVDTVVQLHRERRIEKED